MAGFLVVFFLAGFLVVFFFLVVLSIEKRGGLEKKLAISFWERGEIKIYSNVGAGMCGMQ